jgi:tetratricopeptide (TPR) repeat protein
VGTDGRLRVTDFGLARLVEGDEPGPSSGEGAPGRAAAAGDRLTRTGQFVGSPAYTAPEQMEGRPADARADLFSFCVALYEALYDDRPFAARTIPELRAAIASDAVAPPPRGARVPAWVRRALLRGLRSDPDQRWPSMDALLAELSRDPARRRARAQAAAAGALALGALAFAGLRAREQGRALCRGGEEQVASAWSAARREDVSRAFRATGLPFAEHALGSVLARLDGWAQRWAAMHREACEATRLRGEQSEELLDLRMHCLRERLVEARAVAGQLAAADARLVENVDRALTAVGPLERCANAPLLRDAEREPAAAPARAELARMREDKARAYALIWARPQEAQQLLGGLLKDARKAGHRALLSEVLYTDAIERLNRGERDQAERALNEAALLASLAGRHDLAGLALVTLILPAGYGGRLEEALRFSELARAEIERAGDEGIELHRLMRMGDVLNRYQRGAEAAELFRKAIALCEKRADRQLLPNALSGLTLSLVSSGRAAEALEVGRRLVALSEELVGPAHPQLARLLANGLAVPLDALGRDGEVEQVLRRIAGIEEGVLGPKAWALGTTLTNLGHNLRRQGRPAEALEPLQRAAAIREQRLPGASIDLAHTLGLLGGSLVDLRRPAEARVHLDRALRLMTAQPSPPPDYLADVRFHLARSLWDEAGRRAESRTLAQQARTTYVELHRAQELAETERWLRAH